MSFCEPCPICQSAIHGKLKGVFSKHLVIPAYCGMCGTPLFSECPSCNIKLLHLSFYCPSCRTILYANTAIIEKKDTTSLSTIPQKQQLLLAKINQDVDDSLLSG